jgi:hypothetical protein
MQLLAKVSVLLGLIALTSGCVVATPRDGYYHERGWHDCGPHDDSYCR